MACSILTEERWSQLLEGRLSEEARLAILDHIDSDCPDCEYLFERMTDEEELRLRELFNQKAAQRRPPWSVENAVGADASPERAAKQSGFFGATSTWIGGMAAALVVAIGLARFTGGSGVPSAPAEPAHLQFDKGSADPGGSINLQFAIGRVSETGGGVKVDRGVLGERVGASDRLFLHYDISPGGYVYIFGYGAGKQAALIGPDRGRRGVPLAAGSYDVASGGAPDGIPLTGIQGRYTVIGIRSPKPIEELDGLITAIQRAVDARTGSLDESAINSTYKDITLSIVYFDVAA